MTEKTRKAHGGARLGAGRKPDADKKHDVVVRLTDAEHETLRTLGGSAWLRKMLKELPSAIKGKENEKV